MPALISILDLIRIKATIRLIPLILIGAFIGFYGKEFSVIDFLKILIGSFTFISAGMALNDLLGHRGDRRAKAGAKGHYDNAGRLTGRKPLISGDLTVIEAGILTLILMAITTIIAVSFPEPINYYLLIIGVLSIILEILYQKVRYISPAGTLISALLFGLFPVGGYIAVTGSIDGILILLFIFGFFWEVSHNILADIIDVDGDRIRKLRTIPISFETGTAGYLAFISAISTVFTSILIFYSAGFNLIPVIASILAGFFWISNLNDPLAGFSNAKNYLAIVLLAILISLMLA